jgi:hypothetical protein
VQLPPQQSLFFTQVPRDPTQLHFPVVQVAAISIPPRQSFIVWQPPPGIVAQNAESRP